MDSDFYEVGEGGEEDGAQVVSRSSESPSATRSEITEAQSRVVKLEASITALGENDPAVPRLREELQRVRSQAQVRVEGMRTDLVKAQEAVAKAQETLRHEEALLRDGEARLVALQEEFRRAPQCGAVPPVTPLHFATELRECVQELRREKRRVESRIVRRRRPRREPVQENQDFGNPCARSDVDGPRFIDSAQCDAVRFVGVDDQSGGFHSHGPVHLEQGPDGSTLVEVQKIVCEIWSSWRADWRGGTSGPFFPELRPCSNSRVVGQPFRSG